jgi:hypothetical protein
VHTLDVHTLERTMFSGADMSAPVTPPAPPAPPAPSAPQPPHTIPPHTHSPTHARLPPRPAPGTSQYPHGERPAATHGGVERVTRLPSQLPSPSQPRREGDAPLSIVPRQRAPVERGDVLAVLGTRASSPPRASSQLEQPAPCAAAGGALVSALVNPRWARPTCIRAPRPSHHVPRTTSLAPRPSHHVPRATVLAPRPSRHGPAARVTP